MKDYWRSVIPGYAINNEFLVPFALFFICLVAAIFCFTMPKEWFTHVIAFVWAVIGLLGFPFTKTLHYGNIYWVHYIIFIVGALGIAFSWFRRDKTVLIRRQNSIRKSGLRKTETFSFYICCKISIQITICLIVI